MAAVKDFDYLAKLLLIGDGGTGKTSLILRFVDDEFTSSYISTIGVDFNSSSGLQDTESSNLGHCWGRKIQNDNQLIGIIVVYDITDNSTFQNIPEWLRSIDRYCLKPPQKILVGTKLDLATASRQVEYSQAKALAEENCLKFWETSSKDGTNVEEAIMSLLADIKNMKEAEEQAGITSPTGTVSLPDPHPPDSKTCC
ncbi:Small GTPase superfamily [Pelomyxa schiedti]|nr:Small GTPase superfamily [Pelomyxa schiedti]